MLKVYSVQRGHQDVPYSSVDLNALLSVGVYTGLNCTAVNSPVAATDWTLHVQVVSTTIVQSLQIGTTSFSRIYSGGVLGAWAIGNALLWANRPSANSVPAGASLYFSDQSGGSWWESDGVSKWRPCPTAVVGQGQADIIGAANTSEQILMQSAILAGTLQMGLYLTVRQVTEKSGTVDTMTIRWRIGATGTLADPIIDTATATGTQSVHAALTEFVVTSTTNLRHFTRLPGAPYTAGTAYGTASVDNPIDNTTGVLYLSSTAQMTSGTEYPIVRAYKFEVKR